MQLRVILDISAGGAELSSYTGRPILEASVLVVFIFQFSKAPLSHENLLNAKIIRQSLQLITLTQKLFTFFVPLPQMEIMPELSSKKIGKNYSGKKRISLPD